MPGLVLGGLLAPTVADGAAPAVRVTRTVATGLDVPWNVAPLPDGSGALVSQRDTGVVSLVAPRGGRVRQVGRVAVTSGGEGGLLGLALSPSFSKDHWVYAYYSTARDNRVVRMQYAGGRLGGTHLLLSGIPRGSRHNGGGLAFSPKGMLYVSTGDSGDSALAQRRGSLAGKVLRMHPDGRRPTSNPFGSYVWSVGHRNPQGLAFDADGRLWATEFGNNAWDEPERHQQGEELRLAHGRGPQRRQQVRRPEGGVADVGGRPVRHRDRARCGVHRGGHRHPALPGAPARRLRRHPGRLPHRHLRAAARGRPLVGERAVGGHLEPGRQRHAAPRRRPDPAPPGALSRSAGAAGRAVRALCQDGCDVGRGTRCESGTVPPL
ncbi:hypothetical protein GCM10025868_42870 [Angustibacter aerolatus]|uniref:Glucose/Sorbosone dehydrogenase domain-containing protein n=1 Tax=Angustibacter aerolatus TaxID=1162965 RepID=A0ABQ6JL89_9ACTN|nr:hypothetical protein GCM10025868_42870 [Angustibacter aerolatus]